MSLPTPIKVSICIATHHKPDSLDRVLGSIYKQSLPFQFEVIVVDDAPIANETKTVCDKYPTLRYFRIDREPTWQNPAKPRNLAYRNAVGEIIICQSDDVMHVGNAIQDLVNALKPGTFVIATVTNVDPLTGEIVRRPAKVFSSPKIRRPLFFLGALYRKDLYAVGGNDEDFVNPGWEDQWFAECLIHGLNLTPVYTSEAKGKHLHHERTVQCNPSLVSVSEKLYHQKMQEGSFTKNSWSPNKIDKHMYFFWGSGAMPWLRYQTLVSFRKLNPDWKMTLAICNEANAINGPEKEYTDSQPTIDYLPKVQSLDVEVHNWKQPNGVRFASQASDLYCWETLANNSGWYADLDILFLQSMHTLDGATSQADAVFIPMGHYMTVGFIGSNKCSLFANAYEVAINRLRHSPQDTQICGSRTMQRLACHCNNFGRRDTFLWMQKQYPQFNLCGLPPSTLYTWDWQEAEKWFAPRSTTPPSPLGLGIHWYGGLTCIQDSMKRLTEDNYQQADHLLLNYVIP